jgi:ubiquinone/menaquinone biosynthesis C-methylase UbiE
MSPDVPTTNFSSSWTRVDQTTDPSFYSQMLDATRAQLLEAARLSPAEFFAPLKLAPGSRVLDVGCGTGDYLRVVAGLIAPGQAIGIDLSELLTAEATRRNSVDEDNVSFRVADAYELPFPDGSFDCVLANQVLLHLAEPWRAVAEMRRVLAPAGRLSIGEWDWDSTCLALSDRELGRHFTHLICDHMTNGLIVRQLASQLLRLGFAQVELDPQVRLSRDLDAAFRWLIEPATLQFVHDGTLTEDEGARLLDDLKVRAQTGDFFMARIYYATIATATSQGHHTVSIP